MKEEKKPGKPWEIQDPKPPVIQSGNLEQKVVWEPLDLQ